MQNEPNNKADKRQLTKTATPGIFKRGKSYVVVYRVGGKQRKRYARTMSEARRMKAAVQTDIARGEFQEQTRLTFREYAEKWVERYQGTGKGFRESTRQDYRSDLSRFALPYFGEKIRLCDITPLKVAGFVEWLCDEQSQGRLLADKTVRRILGPVRSCFRSAVREGLIRHNPTRDLALPHRPRIEDDEGIQVFTREQLAVFLQVVHPRYRAFFKLLAATGLRIGEAIALEWRHLELNGSSPHAKVRQRLYRGSLAPPKSRYGKRNVPLDQELVSELRGHRMAASWAADNDPVFPSEAGTPLTVSNVRRRILQPAAEEAGAPWAGFHTFRHTFASMLFERGANPKQVQTLLGHHSASFTLNTYVHLMGGDLGKPLSLSEELGETTAGSRSPTETGQVAESSLIANPAV